MTTEVSHTALFARPHRLACASHVDMNVAVDVLRRLPSHAAWRAAVAAELRDVYGLPPSSVQSVAYSAHDCPDNFVAELDTRVFDVLHRYDAAKDKLGQTQRECEAALRTLSETLASIDALVVANGSSSGGGGDATSDADHASRRASTRRALRTQQQAAQTQQARVRRLRRDVADAEHACNTLAQQLSHTFDMCAVRVFLTSPT